MNKEEVDKFCREYYGFTLEDADGSIGYWMGKYQELEQENKELKEELQKADSITQSCIFDGKEESQLNYRKAIKTIEELHNKIDKAIDFIDIYTNGINLEAFDCLKLMYKIKDLLKDSDVDGR